jgi:hypothetical protein
MARSALCVVCGLLFALSISDVEAQHLSSARGIGIGAYTALVNDLSALDWNPAGLVHVKDWEIMASNYFWVEPSGGLVFQGMGLSKRFMEQHTASIRYAPAISLEFEVPSIFRLEGSGQTFSFDKKIHYQERYALGYGFRAAPTVSLGVSARFLQEEVVDTEPYFVQDTVARLRAVNYNADSWNVDFGLLWEPMSPWKFGVVAKNLFKITESEFPQDIRSIALRTTKTLRAGVSYAPSQSFLLSYDLSTTGQSALGWEWKLSDRFSLRQGTYVGGPVGPFVQAISTGVGWRNETTRIDLSYIRFSTQANRSNLRFDDFVAQGVKDISFNQFSPSQFTLTVNIALGRTREVLARIDHVEILDEVYPASYYVHAYRPLGKAIVRNVSNTPIQARVGFYAERFMDAPTLTRPYLIGPNATAEVPFNAVFNETIRSVSSMILQVGDVFVKADPASDYDDKVPTSLIIRGRNDWDGDVVSLRAFVTPEDPELLRFTRAVLANYKDSLAESPKELEHFKSAVWLFNEFSRRVVYVSDPNASKDRVQYPSETLSLRGGDCDDMTVLYATMLASIGIPTAFVDVIPPNRPKEGHIYMLFDTGIPASKAQLISANPKRYVLRKNENGQETVWIPIETTAITQGFYHAWEVGAKAYYEDVEIGLGLIRGWVRIVDVLQRW